MENWSNWRKYALFLSTMKLKHKVDIDRGMINHRLSNIPLFQKICPGYSIYELGLWLFYYSRLEEFIKRVVYSEKFRDYYGGDLYLSIQQIPNIGLYYSIRSFTLEGDILIYEKK